MNQGKLEVVKPRRSNTGDGKSERQHFRNQQTKMNWNWVNLTQMRGATPGPRSSGCAGAGGPRGAIPRSRSGGAQNAPGDQWRNNSRKNEETETKQKQHPVVDITSDRSKV